MATAAEWLGRVRARENQGDLLGAFDLARRGLGQHPSDMPLKHRALLALARAGAADEARRLFESWGLVREEDGEIVALRARLAKDVALAAVEPAERRRLATEAAGLYEAAFERTGDYYPGINAATLWLIAGDAQRAEATAESVLAAMAALPAPGGYDAYYQPATEAEARLLRGETEAARRALETAARALPDDFSARATTRKQLRLIAREKGLDESVVEPLAAPTVAHFTGHMIAPPGAGGRFPAEREAEVTAKVRDLVARHDIRFGFGSLAAGADLIIAEAILANNGSVHAVLPFDEAEFVETSVRPSGEAWLRRYRRVRQRVDAVSFATEDAYLGDDMLFGYCARYAMGLAQLRARFIDAPLLQLAVWDGEPGNGVAGTGADVAAWQACGLPRVTVWPGGAAASGAGEVTPSLRVNRAMLFGDVKGFSKLSDREMPAFVDGVLGAVAEALEPFVADIQFRNTWGDGLFVVFEEIVPAARCALALQSAIRALDMAALGLPGSLAMRIGAHYGPVYPLTDPILARPNSFGAQVSRAARIEPVATPGSVYVSEPFAAMLELTGDGEVVADYVGTTKAAKKYGAFAMYRLRHGRHQPGAAGRVSARPL